MGVPLSRALAAEGIGTFALIFFGPGAAVVQAQTGALGHAGVALAFGLTVATVIAALAPISGAHINPAATFALVLAGKFPISRALPYVLAQLIGATLAAFLLMALFGMEGNVGVTVPNGRVGQAFALETVLTFFLLLVALRSGLPWVVGGVVALEAMIGRPDDWGQHEPGPQFWSGARERHLDGTLGVLGGSAAGRGPRGGGQPLLQSG